jgi:hypothetical protein
VTVLEKSDEEVLKLGVQVWCRSLASDDHRRVFSAFLRKLTKERMSAERRLESLERNWLPVYMVPGFVSDSEFCRLFLARHQVINEDVLLIDDAVPA